MSGIVDYVAYDQTAAKARAETRVLWEEHSPFPSQSMSASLRG